MAWEDYKHRTVGSWLLWVLFPLGLVFGILDGSFTWPLVVIFFVGILIIFIFDWFNKHYNPTDRWLASLDTWIAFACIAALNFMALLAFLASLSTLAIISLLKGKESRRKAPFITIYLIWLVITFFVFFVGVALRL